MGWYPGAQALKWEKPDGGSMIGGGSRGVIHTTESFIYHPSTTSYYGHVNPPHFTYDPSQDKLYQHIDVTRAARALRNMEGGIQTNRQGKVNIQIELVWKAGQIDSMPDIAYRRLFELMTWAKIFGVPLIFTQKAFTTSIAWGTKTPYRMTFAEWGLFSGWCGHQHVPENDHWDPGPFRAYKIMDLAVQRPLYSDMLPIHPQFDSVEWVTKMGIMGHNGSEGRFDPNAYITRLGLAVALHRYHIKTGG